MDDECAQRCYEAITARLCRDHVCYDATIVTEYMVGAGFAVTVEEVATYMRREREEVLEKTRKA